MELLALAMVVVLALWVLVLALAAAAARGDRQPSTVYWRAPEAPRRSVHVPR